MKISYKLIEATDNKGAFMQTTETLRQDIHRNRATFVTDSSSKITFDFHLIGQFYPRDAMLARVFATATCPSVCLSVCPSVTRRYCA